MQCYLLGCYLGNGHVTHRPPSTWSLRIACDQRYPAVLGEIREAMRLTFYGRPSTRYASSTDASDVVAICHPAVGQAFPQHRAGRKHLRPIVLVAWQLELKHAGPGALIRGLIHSDGCRVINRFRATLPSDRVAAYPYVRYFFSNLSTDIRGSSSSTASFLGSA